MIVFTFLALCAFTGVQSAPEFTYSCPDNYIMYEALNQCHQISTSKAKWVYAEAGCKDLNGNLAIIDDQPENDYLSEKLGDNKFWIGLNDQEVDETFVYSGAPNFTVTFLNWDSRQPTGKYYEYEDCVEVQEDGYWNDRRCNYTRHNNKYVCETEVIKTLKCPEDWLSNDNDTEEIYGCYKIFEEADAYENAIATCEKEGAHLYFPKTEAENIYVSNEIGKDYWIGINDIKNEGNYVTALGKTEKNMNWCDGQPTDQRFFTFFWKTRDCVRYDFDCKCWDDERCSHKFPYICKKNETI